MQVNISLKNADIIWSVFCNCFSPSDFDFEKIEDSVKKFSLSFVQQILIEKGDRWLEFEFDTKGINEIKVELIYVGIRELVKDSILLKEGEKYSFSIQFYFEYIDCLSEDCLNKMFAK